jgi:hypothetical protein
MRKPNVTEAIQWARSAAQRGDYLIEWTEAELAAQDESRMGFSDEEVASIDRQLARSGLQLAANHLGVYAEALAS